jgi:hypothetical protein
MSDEDSKAELERLRNENAALKKGAASPIRMKVSEKGAVSIYGMGRFPVTLYKEQWLKLLEMSDDIRAFIAAHQSELKSKARSAVALGRDKQACLTDEKEAQETLTKNWNSNTKANQKLCVEEDTTGGPSSYVESLSCLDVMRDAKKLGADPFRGSTAPGSPPASGSATAQ